MARVFDFPRLAPGLAGASFAVCLAAACGGSDVINQPDGSTQDAHAPDGEVPDANGSDATVPDSGSPDADAGAAVDSGPPDADAGLPDGLADGPSSDGDANTGQADADAGLTADTSGTDATFDSAGDVVVDVTLDVTLDVTPDVTPDVTLDVSPDVALDAATDVADADASFDSGTSGLMQSLVTAAPFVVLGGATVTNSGVSTVLIGDVGTTGPSITGLTGPPFQPSGRTEVNNAVATQAVLDLGTAYTSLTGQACPPANHLTGQDLGGMTLAPGVYCFTSSAGQISATTLTFDAKGDPNAVWIIQVASALTIMDNATAVVIGGPPSLACRIFWTPGTAATINGGSHFLGNIVASSQTSMLTNATLAPGRAFGITDGVTLLSNTITAAVCP